MIVSRGMGINSSGTGGPLVTMGYGRLASIVASAFQDLVEFLVYITRSVSLTVER